MVGNLDQARSATRLSIPMTKHGPITRSNPEPLTTNPKPPIHVMMLGLRGFPNVQGGIETHVENLAPLLVERGCRVSAIVRPPYMPRDLPTEWRGVRYAYVWSPRSRSLEAIIHTFLGVLRAALTRPDILHVHAVGPALLVPLARALGMKVVVTHHGPDYDRQKWGFLARTALKLGEYAGMRLSSARIAISQVIQRRIGDKHHRESFLIPNGVSRPTLTPPGSTLERFGLEPRRFVLMVSRLVPEKRHMDLVQAFAAASVSEWKLALVGASDHPDEYTKKVLAESPQTPGVVTTGFQTGTALSELYANAGIFVLPSSHEGLPIALLEALSYGLPSIASDIPANLEVGLNAECYFPVGNVAELCARLRAFTARPYDEKEAGERRRWVAERFGWPEIVDRTLVVYRKVLEGRDI
jgi:glycosyltransferase involved in cell wall biosynthesis